MARVLRSLVLAAVVASLCGRGAEVASIVDEEAFWDLDGPLVRITTPHIPLPAAEALEDMAIPSADRVSQTIAATLD